MHMVEYRRNQKQLMETPASLQGDRLDVDQCQLLIRQALERKQLTLDTHLAHPILQAAGLSTLPTWIVSDAIEATLTAEQIGYPVAVKLRSPDILHKSAVHGVMLNLRTSAEVAQLRTPFWIESGSTTPVPASKACWYSEWRGAAAAWSCGSGCNKTRCSALSSYSVNQGPSRRR